MIEYFIATNYDTTALVTNGSVSTTPMLFTIHRDQNGNPNLDYIKVRIAKQPAFSFQYIGNLTEFEGQSIDNKEWVLINFQSDPLNYVVNHYPKTLNKFKSSKYVVGFVYFNPDNLSGSEQLEFVLEWSSNGVVQTKSVFITHQYS